MKIIKGKDPDAIITTISVPQIRGLNQQVSKESLRSLRVGWMYKNSSNLWLTDEVCVKSIYHKNYINYLIEGYKCLFCSAFYLSKGMDSYDILQEKLYAILYKQNMTVFPVSSFILESLRNRGVEAVVKEWSRKVT